MYVYVCVRTSTGGSALTLHYLPPMYTSAEEKPVYYHAPNAKTHIHIYLPNGLPYNV